MAAGYRCIQIYISTIVFYSTYASIEFGSNEFTPTKKNEQSQDSNIEIINKDGNDSFTWEAKELSQNIVFSSNKQGENSGYEKQVQIPTSIEVSPDSLLYTEYSQSATINFQVTNNRYSYVYYTFDASSEDLIIHQIIPRRSYITPKSSIQVKVTVSLQKPGEITQPTSNILTFIAKWSTSTPFNEESVIKRVYIHAGKPPSDSSKPSISYTFSGDCEGSLDPKNCQAKMWRADITIEDSDSGLLMIRSIPVGLILNKEFIVGTKETITGYYRASCCQTKVDIVARDLYGNEKSLEIDIERIWLSTGEIISIVLGSILLLIVIVCIIIWIICIRRKKSRTLNIYPEMSRS